MGECIEHFSHEHPLSLFEVDADEDPKPHMCSVCCLPILSSPSYTCSIASCNFFVHKPCTQLPKEFDYILHKETLFLGDKSSGVFRYRCWNHSECKFDLHPLEAIPVEIKSKHRSHESHPLVAFCKEIKSLCYGCGEEETGFFFHCHVCNFWIHQDCTILPSYVKLTSHPHPFILAYSFPYMPSHTYSLNSNHCSICGGWWRLPNAGVYFCVETNSFAHVACAKPIMEKVISDMEILHLPDEGDMFPSLSIRKFVEGNPKKIKIENKMMSKYHQHPLILEDAYACSTSSEDSDAVCDVCVKPINGNQFYRCLHDCRFLAHPICANHLPHGFEIFESLEAVLLQGDDDDQLEFFNSVFLCSACNFPSNGFSYKMEYPDNQQFVLDIECAVTPKIIKHASHKQHILFYAATSLISETSCQLSCCSEGSYESSIYRCVVCDYIIHARCALLPRLTRHKFDDHPLELIMRHELEVLFCEVCEREFEHKWWYYGCNKCEHYFHINCIPSVGFHSKVKFGKSHVDYQLHHHPLTLTRMLTHERHETCGLCNQTIKGFSDDQMAFHCSPCYFWLHFSCASATTKFKDYSKVLEWWRNSNLHIRMSNVLF